MILVRLAYVAELPAPAESRAFARRCRPARRTRRSRLLHRCARQWRRLRPPRRDRPPAAPSARRSRLPRPRSSQRRRPRLRRRSRGWSRCRKASTRSWPCSTKSARRCCGRIWPRICISSHFEPGRIEFRPTQGAPRDLANRLGQLLGEWTGARWLIAITEAEGDPTLRQRQEQREAELRNGVAAHPLVQAVLETFPGATIAAVRERSAAATDGEIAAGLEPGIDDSDTDAPNREEDRP